MLPGRTALRQLGGAIGRWDWILLLAAAPLLLFPAPARTPAMLLIVLPWLVRAGARRPALPRTPLNGALLLLSLMVLVSVWATFDLTQSLPKIAGMILGLGLYFALARIETPRGWVLALATLLGGSLGLVGISLIGTQWPAKLPLLGAVAARLPLALRGLPGAESGFGPNQVAGTLAWVVPLAWALTAHAWRHGRWIASRYGQSLARVWRMLVTLAALLTTLALALTQSRGAAAGLALTLLIGGAGVAIRHFGRRAWVPIGVTFVSLAVLAAYGLRAAAGPARGAGAPGNPSSAIDTLPGRLELWSRSIDAIQAFPLTGTGMNTARIVVPMLFPLFLLPPEFDVSHAHNELLQAALDLGLPGLVAFLAIYMVAAGMLWQIGAGRGEWSRAAWPPELCFWLVVGFGGGLLAHFLFGLTDAVALGAKTGIFFWYVLGLLASLFGQLAAAPPSPVREAQASPEPAPSEPKLYEPA